MTDSRDTKDFRPSRTQLKREMAGLQKLAEELVALGPELTRKAPMPEYLRDEIMSSFGIKKHEARRRLFQYIGKLMRDVDPTPIREYIEEIRSGRQNQTAAFHEVEQWRDRLVDGDDDLINTLFERFPGMDGQHLRQLMRNARKERAAGKSPKAFRELFRMLRTLQEQHEQEETRDVEPS